MYPQLSAPAYGQAGHRPRPAATPSRRARPRRYPASPSPSPEPASRGPAPGYYPNPAGQGMRWWDGENWAPHDS
ncbi:MAG: DUF2510 domain-containing protein [Jatrophihabitantaceae bacterium]